MSEIEDVVEDDEMDFENQTIVRAKWTIDGSKTLSEAATKLRSFADWLEKIESEGHQLIEPVNDDYGFVEPRVLEHSS